MNKWLLSGLCVFLYASLLQANISVSIPQMGVTVKEVNGYAEFTKNEIYGEPGCPLLPARRYVFLVPPDADLSTVSFHIQGIAEKSLEGSYKIKPALPPGSRDGLVWPKDRNIVDGKDIDVYSDDEYYPKEYIQDISVGKLRCYKLVEVRVYFSKFNPVSGKLKCIADGKLILNFARKSRKKEVSYMIPAKFKKLAKKLAANYDEMAPEYNSIYSFTQETKYIIMTESSIESGSEKLEDLKKSKEDRGFEVEILTESDWGGGTGDEGAENIRNWLKDNYESMNIEYVLFIGSSPPNNGKVPMKMTKSNFDTPSDFYYQDISGDWEDRDGFAEISAGRIPVYNDDLTTLDGILQRIIDYENTPVDDIGWRTNALLAEKPFKDDTPGSNMFEELRINFLDPQQWNYYRIYDDNNGDPDESSCSKSAVKNAWKSDNYGLVEWMTHGSQTNATDIMESPTTLELASEYPPIVCMGSCSNGTITNSENLAFSMLKNVGIASVGASVMTLYNVGQTSNYDSTNHIQGMVFGFGKGIVADSLGAGDALNGVASAACKANNEQWHNILAYNLFGCPDVGVFTCANLPFVKVISPNGGDLLEQGDTVGIAWDCKSEEKVKIELVKGDDVVKEIEFEDDSLDSCAWVIPEDVADGIDYKIRVTYPGIDSVLDESDSCFTINSRPEFASEPEEEALQNNEYMYEITGEDKGDLSELRFFGVGELPEWLELKDNEDGTAELSGTPEEIEDYNVTIGLTDGIIEDTVTQSFTLKVQEVSIKYIPSDPGNGAKSARLLVVPNPVEEANEVNFFFASKSGNVIATLTVYDALGNEVYKRVEQRYLYESYKLSKLCSWDLRERNGKLVSGSVYIAVLKIEDLATGDVDWVKNRVGIKK